MSWDWLDRLTESKKARELEERKQRLHELATGDDFKNMVRVAANDIIREREEISEHQKREKIKAHDIKVTKAKEDIQTVSSSMQDSSEPFVNVLGMGFDKHRGLKTSLDWNDAFIRFLHAAGIKGSNDEETIRLWMANIWYDISQEALASDYVMNGVDDTEMPSLNYDQMFGLDENGNPIDDDDDVDDDDNFGVQPEKDWPRE